MESLQTSGKLLTDCSSAPAQENGDSDQTLSSREMDIIKSLDSRSFGFLDLAPPSPANTPDHSNGSANKTHTVSSTPASTISFMSTGFLRKGINMLRIELLSKHTSQSAQSKILCHIAHLHLLLSEYTEALSAYQHCSMRDPDISNDTSFLYGVGLIYYALSKYEWALEAFKKVLLLSPNFARLNEVHVRIGLISKKQSNLDDAIKHFLAALAHSGPCCISKLEINFHIGHIHHIKGDFHKAKQSFESILASKNVPNDIKALTLRQLGWLYHTIPHIATKGEQPHSKAIELLKLAVSANPHSGQAWYFLGRCHADQGQYREAFHAYRQSVVEVEGHADTWCAIGILYQQMGQARDSLQAYITAVFFCPTHVETWTDLGLLYESCDQLVDGFLCYRNGLNVMEGRGKVPTQNTLGFEGVNKILSTRVRFVEHQIQQGGGVAFHAHQNSLPTLLEAWTSLVPQHLREKYTPSEIPILQMSSVSQFNSNGGGIVSPGLGRGNKHGRRVRSTKDPIIMKNMNDRWVDLSPNKLIPGGNMDGNADPRVFNPQLMPDLPPNFIPPQPDLPIEYQPGSYYGNNPPHNLLSPSSRPQHMLIDTSPLNPDTTPTEIPPNNPAHSPYTEGYVYNGRPYQQHLLNHPIVNYQGSPVPSNGSFEAHTLPHDLSAVHPLQLVTQNVTVEDYLGSLVSDHKPTSDRTLPDTVLGKRAHYDSVKHTKMSPLAPPISPCPRSKRGLSDSSSSGISSSHVTSDSSTPSPMSRESDNLVRRGDERDIPPIPEPFPGLGNEWEYMSTDPFRPPSPPVEGEGVDLDPEVIIHKVFSYGQGMSEELHKGCTDTDVPICMIRGLAQCVRFDMNLFTTSTLIKQCGDHDVETREQNLQAPNENWDITGKKPVWKCESNRSLTTVQEYGEYQLSVIEEERQGGIQMDRRILKFGTNCDLSDKNKWSKQLDEIKKLPKFLQVECPEANLLNHVGHTILGMNTVQLYMKVPGSRTPGHQENNNFCSVNINIGPGNCEWFAVSNKYWGVVNQLCDKYKICFLTGSWWPILEELKELDVPVYQFTQYKGDVVWINPGTVHWVQANSSCNNIAWNVGSLTAHQLRMAWERYQWNKVKRVRSIVPMITLTWNLAKRMRLTDPHSRQQISSYLYSSYKQCQQLMDQLMSARIPIMWHGRVEGELTPTCTQCTEEVFNILFVATTKKGDHLVHCYKCVQQIRSKNKKATFTVLQQYTMTELHKTLSRYLAHVPFPSNHNDCR